MLFLIENNHYAFSTPTSAQYRCRRLSDRATGYGIAGRTIDGTDPWEVYSAVIDLLDAMHAEPAPAMLECMTLRLQGHAAYDKGLYVPEALMAEWRRADPLPRTAAKVREVCGLSDGDMASIEAAVDEEVRRGAGQGDGRGPAAAADRRLARLRRQRRLRQRRRRLRRGERRRPSPARVEPLRPAASRTATRSAWPWNTFWPAIRRPFWPAWTSASTARLSRRARG